MLTDITTDQVVQAVPDSSVLMYHSEGSMVTEKVMMKDDDTLSLRHHTSSQVLGIFLIVSKGWHRGGEGEEPLDPRPQPLTGRFVTNRSERTFSSGG